MTGHERLVHALAQLPEPIHLQLRAADAQTMRLAEAYGIAGRLREGSEDAFLRGGERLGVPVAATPGELVDRLDPATEGHPAVRGDDAVFAGHRIVVVTNVPAPYRHGLFARMQARLEAAGASFCVLFEASGQRDRPWIGPGEGLPFEHAFLRSLELPVRSRRPLLPRDLERRLGERAPTVILHGGFSPLSAPRVAAYARRRGAALGFWSGELPGLPSTRGRGLLRRRLLRAAGFAVAYGSPAAGYLRGLSDVPLVIGRNSAAVPDAERDRPARPETVELVTIGDLNTARKGVDVLIDALALVRRLPCRLTVIGDGALGAELRARARGDERVVFAGSMDNAAARAALLRSDAYLTPVREEVFGLALLEAMGAGLAAVSSPVPGMLADLGVHERTVLVAPDHCAPTWAAAVERVVTDHGLRAELGDRARRTVLGRWSLDHAADAMLAGLRLGIGSARR